MSLILVVDDNEPIRAMLDDMLKDHGYEVLQAGLVEKANEFLKSRRPDLIILDVLLPDMNGFDYCRLLRRRTETRDIPIIIITATEKDKVVGFQAGADDYMMKPLQMAELLERVRAVLRRTQARSAAPAVPAPEAPALAIPPAHAADLIRPSAPPTIHGPPQTQPAAISPVEASMTWAQTACLLLFEPETLPCGMPLPPGGPVALAAFVASLVVGLSFAPGARISLPLAAVSAAALWGLSAAALVIAASLFGLELTWRDGARLISLAGLPVTFKLLGGLALALVTSLSPLQFTAGPGLFFAAPPGWIERIDLFELWSAGLVWVLLKNRKGPPRAAASCAAVVWLVVGLSASIMEYLARP